MSAVSTAPRIGSTPSVDQRVDRVLRWEGCFNVRDLGGLEISDGRQIRWGALVRSDIPSRLSENGRAALVAHGVTSIVDLRFVDEVASDWDRYPFKGDDDDARPLYRNGPFHEWGADGPDETRIAAYRAAQTRA